ncbi:putative bifunctional diguanylate cyclase/phosphodiesterase [Parasphingorhabdus sp.]|uniref:putative bifunctional diguanylate cyclase/phosphodiesterase n=1 Tax=Parasphingorhabdus sp. TaxID=2709688 RepID=UPI003A94C669
MIRLLLLVIAVDTIRNIVENIYFGLLWGSSYGIFPEIFAQVLSQPNLLIIPKALNVLAAFCVLVLLVFRHLPDALLDKDRAESKLEETEQRFRMLVDSVKEYAIYMLDVDGNITSWNAGAERIKGYKAEEAIGMNESVFYTAADRASGAPALAIAKARSEGYHETRAERVRKDGSTFWATVAVNAIYGSKGEIIGFAKVTKDITESHTAAKLLEHQAHHDQLTGLLNRSSLYGDMHWKLNAGHEIGLAVFDLDGFKEINDTQGHIAGDRLLQEVAKRIIAQAGPTARVYRLGGDEFVVLDLGRDALALASTVERILRELEKEFVVAGVRQTIGASAGIAFASDEVDPEIILANADLALYDAKAAGGRRYTAFTPAMRARAQARRSLDMQLHRAFENQEFVLHFQPQVRLEDSAIVGAEALLRWNHPEHGLISPAAFIDALANSSVALDCGRWILNEACRTLADWRARGFIDIRMGVNLFPAQFRDDHLEQDIKEALSAHALPGEFLEIEITENIALQQDEAIVAAFRRLSSLGIKLAFDDFGTGYASLSCLTRYPLSRIKIDRSFIAPISGDGEAAEAAIVRPMITMAHYLGLEVIAEGIETVEQLAFLRALGCEEGQGYFYSKPVPEKMFEQLLSQEHLQAGAA